MRFHSAVSLNESTSDAARELIASARMSGIGETDVAFVFFTAHHRDEAEALAEELWLELDPQCIIGCSADGVIGETREVEEAPGLSVLLGQMPGVRVHPFHITTDEWHRLLEDPEDLLERIGCGQETRAVIGFGDPWTTPIQPFLHAFDQHMPHAPLIGGMASAARSAGGNILVRNDQIYDAGFVGASFSGPLEVQSIVSQGCRPIGSTFVVTKAHENVIEQLGGRPAMTVLREVVHELPAHEETLLRNGLFLGSAISEYREKFSRGDFLIRNIMGVNQESGEIATGDFMRVGQTIQFHVRDAVTADEDLRYMLERHKNTPATGGLLFSCNGRGCRLFDQPGHDINVSREIMPTTPFAGFFAAGELGPVGGKNFIHGHTASFALFRNLGS